eukprot:587675-Amphidinium_carterae.2
MHKAIHGDQKEGAAAGVHRGDAAATRVMAPDMLHAVLFAHTHTDSSSSLLIRGDMTTLITS